MKTYTVFLPIFLSLLFTNYNGQNSELTHFTFNKKELKLADFKATSKISYMPYGDDKETLKQKGLKVFKVEEPEKISLLGVKGTSLYITTKKDKIQDYWLRIEGVENVKKLYNEIYKMYPKMISYQDGTLRFKQFSNNNEVLEITINDTMPSDIFMDINFTNDYKNISLNMYKNYDDATDKTLKRIDFKYNSEKGIYQIEKVDNK